MITTGKAVAAMISRLQALAWLVLCVSCSSGAFAIEPGLAVTVTQIGEAFVVEVVAEVPVPLAGVWEVLTDFDHMALFIGNVKSSRVVRREENTLWVRQEGVAEYGPFSLPFKSEREIRLEPKRRIVAKNLSGTMKRLESEAQLGQLADGVRIRYHAEAVPDSAMARMFGATIVRHEVEEQFREMISEMMRRYPRRD
jgi:carbon monoxide dehydrogenase subunit G